MEINMKINKNLVHYVTATVIIVNSEGKFLIAKRADWEKAFPNKWAVPGGKLEVLDYVLKKQDTPEHWYNIIENLCKLECKEEVGVKIDELDYVTSLVYIRDDGVPVLILSMWSKLKDENQKIVLDKSLTDYKWVSLEEAKNYDLIDGIYEELEMLDKKLKTGKMDSWTRNSFGEETFKRNEGLQNY